MSDLNPTRWAAFAPDELRAIWFGLTHDDGLRYWPAPDDQPVRRLVIEMETNMQLRGWPGPAPGGWTSQRDALAVLVARAREEYDKLCAVDPKRMSAARFDAWLTDARDSPEEMERLIRALRVHEAITFVREGK